MRQFRDAKRIFLYLTHRGEVSTDRLIARYMRTKKLFLPCVREREIAPAPVISETNYVNGTFNVREPHCANIPSFRNARFDLVIVPGVVFDMYGNRIGYGKGYFDRFLKTVDCTIIALCFEFQIVENIETHPYDVPVDFLVTEKAIYQCRQLRNKIRRLQKF